MDIKEIKWAESVWDRLLLKFKAETERMDGKIPYIPVNGRYIDMAKENLFWWTNCFWGGILWQLYHATGNDMYRKNAAALEEQMDAALNVPEKLDHDVGFMWLHTAVADYRETKNEKSRERGLRAAEILAGRFNKNGNFIKAWNGDREGWVIIDCLMNLPLLYWATEETGDRKYADIAIAHTETAMRDILRKDGSSNHIVIFDTETGKALENPGGQGYESGSSWSRGQSWAVYGMTLAYLHTGDKDYLDRAKQSAHYFIANAALTDYAPVIDFRAPKEPVYYDSTAGAIAACGMLELAKHVSEYEKYFYEESALRILKSIESRFCDWNLENDGILGYGSACYHREEDREVPIIYGDYFLLEAILRITGKDMFIW